MDTIFTWLNVAPGWKRKIAAVGAFVIVLVQAYNSLVTEFGYGPCLATAGQIADALNAASTCAADWTFKIPDTVNAMIVALMGVGVASGVKNDKADIMAAIKPAAQTSAFKESK